MFFGVSWTFAEIYNISADASNNDFSIKTWDRFVFDTTKKTISGKIFLKKIWEKIELQDTPIILNCNQEKTICGLTIPKISSRIIGDITGLMLRADLTTLSLETITPGRSNIWPVSLNASLESGSVHIKNLKKLTANHSTTLELVNAEIEKNYTLRIQYGGQPPKTYSANENNTFENVDLSLAGKAILTLAEENEANENIIFQADIPIIPGEITKNIENTDFYAKKFCENNASNITFCPDGNTRKWSEINTDKNTYFPWETAQITVKIRDRYGNRINQNTISVEAENSVKNNQTNSSFPHSEANIVIFSPADKFTGNIGKISARNHSSDYIFSVKSLAPTNEDNVLKISKILYGENTNPADIEAKNIIYSPPFSVTENLQNEILNLEETEFNIAVQNYKNTITPYIVGRFSIGQSEDNIEIISSHHCRENHLENSPTENTFCRKEIFDSYSIFGFGGNTQNVKIRPNITNENQNGTLEFFGGYTLEGKKILYKIFEKTFSIKPQESENLTVQSGMIHLHTGNNSGNIDTQETSNIRQKFLNTIEKNIAYLNRNAHGNFSGKNYEIISGDKEIWADAFSTKRSYIILGGDAIIRENILQNASEPLTVIALSRDGVGGNIKIAGDVTNIHATLIAEKSILGADDNKKNQLAIIGSIMADNICKDENNDACLGNLRKDFNFADATTSKKAKNFERNPDKIIIQYNPSIQSNPPPGLENFVE